MMAGNEGKLHADDGPRADGTEERFGSPLDSGRVPRVLWRHGDDHPFKELHPIVRTNRAFS